MKSPEQILQRSKFLKDRILASNKTVQRQDKALHENAQTALFLPQRFILKHKGFKSKLVAEFRFLKFGQVRKIHSLSLNTPSVSDFSYLSY